jgi:hypothetical protein
MSIKRFSDKSQVELIGDDAKIALFRISVWANHMEEPNKFDAKWDLTAAEYQAMGPAWTAFVAAVTQEVVKLKNAIEN